MITADKAGFCLAASAKRDNMELISVVMAAESSNDRFTGAKKLLDYGFANYSITTPKIDTSSISTIPVSKGVQGEVAIDVEPISNALIKKGEESKIVTEIDIQNSLEAPVSENTQVGTLKVILGEKVIGEYKIFTISAVDKVTFWFSLKKICSFVFSL